MDVVGRALVRDVDAHTASPRRQPDHAAQSRPWLAVDPPRPLRQHPVITTGAARMYDVSNSYTTIDVLTSKNVYFLIE